MNPIPNGCVLLARNIKESEIWVNKPSWWIKVWIYILMNVNHTDNKFFKRGENMFSRKKIYEDCRLMGDRIGAETVDNAIRWLRATTSITTRKTTRGITIKVNKYDDYQNMANYKTVVENDTENDLQNDMENDSETTQKRLRNDTINKNDKNDKNDKPDKKMDIPALPDKTKHMDFIYLTPEQHKLLVDKLGKGGARSAIERLNNYAHKIGQHKFKVRYDSHYHTILSWIDKDIQERQDLQPKKTTLNLLEAPKP